MKGMPGPRGEKRHERQLRPAVAVAKGVDGVELGQKVSSSLDEVVLVAGLEKIPGLQTGEEALELCTNILRVAEHAAAFSDSNQAHTPGPAVDVLKKVIINRLEVADVQPTGRKGLRRALRRNGDFEEVQIDLIPVAGNVLENLRVLVIVLIVWNFVHAPSGLLAILADDLPSALFSAQSPSIEFLEISLLSP